MSSLPFLAKFLSHSPSWCGQYWWRTLDTCAEVEALGWQDDELIERFNGGGKAARKAASKEADSLSVGSCLGPVTFFDDGIYRKLYEL